MKCSRLTFDMTKTGDVDLFFCGQAIQKKALFFVDNESVTALSVDIECVRLVNEFIPVNGVLNKRLEEDAVLKVKIGSTVWMSDLGLNHYKLLCRARCFVAAYPADADAVLFDDVSLTCILVRIITLRCSVPAVLPTHHSRIVSGKNGFSPSTKISLSLFFAFTS